MRGNTFVDLTLEYIPRSHGGIAYPPNPRRSFGLNIQREITNDPYSRAGAYAPLHGFALHANPPSDAGSLALISDQASAEPFRSVCRNVSGKLPSHAFAALTGLRGCAAGAVGQQHQIFKFYKMPFRYCFTGKQNRPAAANQSLSTPLTARTSKTLR